MKPSRPRNLPPVYGRFGRNGGIATRKRVPRRIGPRGAAGAGRRCGVWEARCVPDGDWGPSSSICVQSSPVVAPQPEPEIVEAGLSSARLGDRSAFSELLVLKL